jgi:hypothetical protein
MRAKGVTLQDRTQDDHRQGWRLTLGVGFRALAAQGLEPLESSAQRLESNR